MTNTRLAYRNWVDLSGTVITASPDSTDNPPANIADPTVGVRYRAVDTSVVIDLEFPYAVPAGLFLALGNADEWKTVRWQVSAVAAGDDELYDSGAIDPGAAAGYGLTRAYADAEVEAVYVRLTITRDLSGIIDVGRVMVAPVRTLDYPAAMGDVDTWVDSSTVTDLPRSGGQQVDAGVKYRTLDFQLPALTAADRDFARELNRIVGLGGQIYVDPVPDAADWPRWSIYGRLSQVPGLTHKAPDLWEAAYRVRSSWATDAINGEMV